MQCRADLCAATYKSFNAADCTYQPLGGGPRSVCELNKAPADTPRQSARTANSAKDSAATSGSTSGPDDKQTGEKSQDTAEAGASEPAGSQCNRSLCASTYHSFHAADCTFQPEGGGPRQLCDR